MVLQCARCATLGWLPKGCDHIGERWPAI
jgi:hypothetical protein